MDNLPSKSKIKDKNYIYGCRGNRIGQDILYEDGDLYVRKPKNQLTVENINQVSWNQWVKI